MVSLPPSLSSVSGAATAAAPAVLGACLIVSLLLPLLLRTRRLARAGEVTIRVMSDMIVPVQLPFSRSQYRLK